MRDIGDTSETGRKTKIEKFHWDAENINSEKILSQVNLI